MNTQREKVLEWLKRKPLVRSSELTSNGIDPKTIQRMVHSGELLRIARGLYSDPYHIPDTYHSLAEAQRMVESGVVCLLSALSYHEIGTQNPSFVWMAIPNKAWKPNIESSPIEIVRFSGAAYSKGIEELVIESTTVYIYSIPKTIADCFKYRNKIGIDVAVEALKDVVNTQKTSINEIIHYAEICRVQKVITPYLEGMLG
jgi:predicted transcriptional regulator of viral defense system